MGEGERRAYARDNIYRMSEVKTRKNHEDSRIKIQAKLHWLIEK